MPGNFLPHYAIIKHGNTTFYVKEKYRDVLLKLDVDALRKEAIEKGSVRTGREPHPVISIPECPGERIIIRHSRHGGLFGYIAGDLYCKRNHFVNELVASETAIEKGVNTAEIIAVIKHRTFGPFYRIDVLSKEIPDSLDLIELLTNPPLLPPLLKGGNGGIKFAERKKIIETVAKTIRKMHDAGLYHTDLHLKNILIQSTSGDTPPSPIPSIKRGERGVLRGKKGVCEFKAYIIDMDKAKRMNVVSARLRVRNLIRLDRSIEKLKAKAKLRMVTTPIRTDKLRFLKAYTGNDADLKQSVRTPARTYLLHRLLWRLGLS